jgi:hypothetical protein
VLLAGVQIAHVKIEIGAQLSFQDELRELRRYEIEWDERYVWD